METILDLHIHSKYSRACSKNLTLPVIVEACDVRGIDVVATGDFTHPQWVRSLDEELVEVASGIFAVKGSTARARFILGTEISCIYSHAGKVRRVHVLVFAPSLAAVHGIIAALERHGCNLRADGRPIIGLSAKQLLTLILEVDSRCVLIPAHAWTPWFAVFGSKSGYDALSECFEDLTSHIFAIETGLSSDPTMNARLSALDSIALISCSDAHSPDKLGREATVLDFASREAVTYDAIMATLRANTPETLKYTIEFFPEEGKYHMDGHAPCAVRCTPAETKKWNGACPKCGRAITVGVLNRIDALADRAEELHTHRHIPHRSIVPLREIVANVLGVGVGSKRVAAMYNKIIAEVGNEFFVLLQAPIEKIAMHASPEIALGVERMRAGNVYISPGYDGVFGTISVFQDAERRQKNQTTLL